MATDDADVIELEVSDVAGRFHFTTGGQVAPAGPGRAVSQPAETNAGGVPTAWAARHRPAHRLVRSYLAAAKTPIARSGPIPYLTVVEDRDPDRWRAEIQRRSEILPALAELDRDSRAIDAALSGAATPVDIKLLVAAIDATVPQAARNRSPDFAAIVEICLEDPIEDESEEWTVSSAVLFSAFVILTKQLKFSPSISEIIEAIKVAKRKYEFAKFIVNRLRMLRLNIEELKLIWELDDNVSNVIPIDRKPASDSAHRGRRRRPVAE